MKQAVILCGGKGRGMWPYTEVRNKAMMKVSNQAIIDYAIQILFQNQFDEIHVVGTYGMSEIKHACRNKKEVYVHEIEETDGDAKTLLKIKHVVKEDALILFSSCLYNNQELSQFIDSNKDLMLQAASHPQKAIITQIEPTLTPFLAYPRGVEAGYQLVGLKASNSFLSMLEYNQGRFVQTKVGVGSPSTHIIEATLNDLLDEHVELSYFISSHVLVIKHPWDILSANEEVNQAKCLNLVVGTRQGLDEDVEVNGELQIGVGSVIRDGVRFLGNAIIGKNTVIENHVVIGDGVVIGDHCTIKNGCKIGNNVTIGNDCIIDFCAEVLGGVLMDKTYFYHYGEFYGLCGERVDLGAGTVCGTLRFDDGKTSIEVNGTRTKPERYSNATYLGDYVRTGVNVIFQPGSMVGTSTVIGSGIVVHGKVASRKLLKLKQEIIESDWGQEKYGW